MTATTVLNFIENTQDYDCDDELIAEYGLSTAIFLDNRIGECKGYDYINKSWIVQWLDNGEVSKVPNNSGYTMASFPGCIGIKEFLGMWGVDATKDIVIPF